jgi:hypothetical protein
MKARVAQLDEEETTNQKSLQQQNALHDALKKHMKLLDEQVEMAEAAHTHGVRQNQLAETDAIATDTRVAFAKASKHAAVRLLAEKGKQLQQQITKAETATKHAEKRIAARMSDKHDITEAMALVETGAGEVSSHQKTPKQEGIQTADDPAMLGMGDLTMQCARSCYNKRGAAQPACMHRCMQRMQDEHATLGESQPTHSESHRAQLQLCARQCMNDVTNRANCMEECGHSMLGEASDKQKKEKLHMSKKAQRIMKIAKHCEYEEAAESLAKRREELNTIQQLSEESAMSLLQTSSAKHDTTWFISNTKDGKKNPKAYDNTSLECACIRNCKHEYKCIQDCVWERS